MAQHTNTSKFIGFSTYLIHQDSIESPMFDSLVSQTNLVERAIRRSRSRLSHFKSILKLPDHAKEISDIESTLVKTPEEYLMEISIGTPPVKQLATIDTASVIVWTQCLPCMKCYEQIQPMFNSRNSLTYNVLRCNTTQCKSLERHNIHGCLEATHKCEYKVTYKDKSITYGDLALETYKIGNTLLPNMVYGCSNANKGGFDMNTAGIIGLGRGPLSLVGQLGHLIRGKFSYCLVNWMERNTRSKISFGANAIVSGRGTVSTRLVSKYPFHLYYVTLEAITIQNKRIKRVTKSIENKKIVEKGNMVIDSGSMLTYLPTDMYQELEDELISAIGVAIPVQNPSEADYKLCYKNTTNIQFPTIIFHFAGGANLALTSTSTTIRYMDLTCLVIVPDNDLGVAIFGHMSQMDYLIGYDLKNWKIYFKPTDCSMHQI
ncbi:aspartic proteinase CDR1-like [Impatiens glandulifera]|uniref:aspartic proteinase CDR1-like n=1 Tax=Impatiens glandulifera TaxID=253017 RepID=UPI001FB0D3ED|nr:aspartic proteinase CDR1-like [Impatiens glandulifera]